jgi:hypothetical protein
MARASRSKRPETLASTKNNQLKAKRPLRAAKNSEKSKYFESATEEEESDFLDAEPSEESDSSLTEEDEEEEEPPKKKAKSTPKSTPQKNATPKSVSTTAKKKKNVSEDEDPWETFIPKEDTPEAGDVEYSDSTIHPNTLQFLRGISVKAGLTGRFGGKQ